MAILGDLFLCFGFFSWISGSLFFAFLLFPASVLLCFSAFLTFFASQTNPIRYSLYEQATCCVCLMSSLQGVHGKYLGSLWEFAGSIYGYSVYSMMCR